MLSEALKKITKGEVQDDSQTLEEFSHDTSLFEVRPKVIVAPRDAEDVKALVRYVAEHKAEDKTLSLMDLKKGEERAKIPVVADKVYDLVLQYGGTITAEHNDGLIRSPYLEKMYGAEVYRLFEEVKKIFDPLGIFNPEKKTGASMEYAMEHLRKS